MHYQWGFWQMKYANRVLIAAGVAALLSACSTGGNGSSEADLQTVPIPQSTGVSDTPVKIGEPYQVAGTTYTPADIADYDQVGYASFYGQELAGSPTANGELFNPAGISGAHKTLPLPSYVRVTHLGNGRSIVVRVNDRGPFVGDRIIDLSYAAAQRLDLIGRGSGEVLVEAIVPGEPAGTSYAATGVPRSARIGSSRK